MKVKMTNLACAQKLDALRELKKMDLSLPTVVGYRIVQNTHALTAALAAYYEMRDEIIKKHSSNGKSINRDTDPESFDACVAELEKIDQIEVEADISQFSLSLLKDRNLPLHTMFTLDFMIQKENS